MKVSMHYRAGNEKPIANFVICITRNDWIFCYGTSCKYQYDGFIQLDEEGKVEVEISNLGLLEGTYYIDLKIQGENDKIYDEIFNLFEFHVTQRSKKDVGILLLDTKWKVN